MLTLKRGFSICKINDLSVSQENSRGLKRRGLSLVAASHFKVSDWLSRTHLGHLIRDLVASSESLDQGSGGHQGPLDGGGQLPGHVPEGSQGVHVVRDASEVVNIEIILAIEDLESRTLIRNTQEINAS